VTTNSIIDCCAFVTSPFVLKITTHNHQPVYPINNKAIFLGKQGAVHACVCIDTVDEWGKYLSVPLK
jgi:hypothetical protein